MKLAVDTRGGSDVRGKPRVYLTCHPEDVPVTMSLIREDILRHANCAIWHDEEPEAPWERSELQAALDEMQLVVLAVSSKFLHEPSRARDVELKYALAHHIPVLPIMLENGLPIEFNRVTDTQIQVIDRYITDPTATPYEEVLDTYLKSVLISDELAEQVRDAFDAYVFLSYRKKDRRHAQRLMHLIHENRQFRDIAIWYDEFLVPGENYNDAIRDAFEKSGLFALAVTPNLLEANNYVMQIEYPLAQQRKQQKGDLEIVPVELYETDRGDPRTDPQRLAADYEGIPTLQDEHCKPEMNAAFLEALSRIARKENDGSARHRFFIGLAYLGGIDVEIDPERALELIRSAAEDEAPCFDATEKLVDMYRTGDGVPRDQQTAIAWQRKLCEQYKAAYAAQHDPDAHRGFGTKYFRALIALSDMLRDAGQGAAAFETAQEALSFGGTLGDEVGVREVERDTALICNRLGGLCRKRGDIEEAAAYYQRAMEIYRRLASDMGTARARRDLSVSLERMGDIARKQKDRDKAEAYYRQARDIRAALADGRNSAGARRDYSAILTKLGNIYKDKLALDEAEKEYRAALDIDRVLAEEQKTPQAWDDYGVSLVKLGDICRKRMQSRDAVEYLDKAVKIFKRNADITGSVQYRKNLAAGLEKLAKAADSFHQRGWADQCYEHALEMREQLADEFPSHITRHELATCCFLYAEFNRDVPLMERALGLWEEMVPRHPEYRIYVENARRMLIRMR